MKFASPERKIPTTQEAINKAKVLKHKKDVVYTDKKLGKNLAERQDVMYDYDWIDMNVDSYEKKTIGSRDFADNLGSAVLAFNREHPSVQVYAYEKLLKSLANPDSEKDVENITNEIVFDLAFTNDRVKSEFLAGLLAYYGGKFNQDKMYSDLNIDEESKIKHSTGISVDTKERMDIFKKIQSGINSNDVKQMAQVLPEVKKVIELITSDFPENTEAGSVSRLIAKYYEMNLKGRWNEEEKMNVQREIFNRTLRGESSSALKQEVADREKLLKKSPTSYPDMILYDIIQNASQKKIKRPSSGLPDHMMKLDRGKHTSQKKIDEAYRFDIPLEIEAVDERGGDQRFRIVLDSMNYPEVDDYVNEVRRLKNAKKYNAIEAERDKLKRIIWSKYLFDNQRAQIGSVDNLDIHSRTIKDFPIDQIQPGPEEDFFIEKEME